MTVPVTYVPTSIVANGATTVFPYNFPILDADHLEVTEDGVIVTTGFTIDGVGELAGGNITYDVAPADGVVIGAERNMPIERLVDYQNLGDLRSETLNDDQDYPIMVLQQIAYRLGVLEEAFEAIDPDLLASYVTIINQILADIIELQTLVAALRLGANRRQSFILALTDTSSAFTAGTTKGRFYMPCNFVPTNIDADLGTAQTSGSAITVDCNVDGVSALSVKAIIANGELQSGVETIDVAALAGGDYIPQGALVTFDIDQVGDGTARWLQVSLIGYQYVAVLEP